MDFYNYSLLAHRAPLHIFLNFNGWCNSRFQEACIQELPLKIGQYFETRMMIHSQLTSPHGSSNPSLTCQPSREYFQFSNRNGLFSINLVGPRLCKFRLQVRKGDEVGLQMLGKEVYNESIYNWLYFIKLLFSIDFLGTNIV